jgi:hypothetical protein
MRPAAAMVADLASPERQPRPAAAAPQRLTTPRKLTPVKFLHREPADSGLMAKIYSIVNRVYQINRLFVG